MIAGRGLSRLFCFSLTAALLMGVVGAQDRTLNVVLFPERRNVDLTFLPTDRIPQAEMRARVRFEDGQARIDVNYDRMKPAVLFGGEVTCYVLWAVTREGATRNLGELWVQPDSERDSARFSTAFRSFALMLTAEAYHQVAKPSDIVIFRNVPSSDRYASNESIVFSDFAPAPEHGLRSLDIVRYDGNVPLDLLQAQRVFETAQKLGAADYASDIYQEAELGLAQASQVARSSGRSRTLQLYARRSVSSSNEAIKVTLRRLEEEELERRIAERRAEMEGLERRAAEAEASAQALDRQRREAQSALEQTGRELEQFRQEMSRLESERRTLQAERRSLEGALESLRREQAALQREKAALGDHLQEALSKIADTQSTARGLIVSLPDILFAVGEASLRPEATLVLAKLAGVLTLMPELKLQIEGHTDSTGSPEYNLRLSQRRSFAVMEFLAGQGVETDRMRAEGFGMERPLADNATAEGRRQNRRVEIVITER